MYVCMCVCIYIYIYTHASAGSGPDLLPPKLKPFELMHLVSLGYYHF